MAERDGAGAEVRGREASVVSYTSSTTPRKNLKAPGLMLSGICQHPYGSRRPPSKPAHRVSQ